MQSPPPAVAGRHSSASRAKKAYESDSDEDEGGDTTAMGHQKRRWGGNTLDSVSVGDT